MAKLNNYMQIKTTRGSKILNIFFLLFIQQGLIAQNISNAPKDERALYAETKQVNQFFRRFNNEEAVDGTRYYDKDKEYRDPKTREKYLKMLFDSQNPALTKEITSQFIAAVSTKDKPVYLDFHGGGWFSQITTKFSWNGKEDKLTMFLELEDAGVGTKWIIKKIIFPPFDKSFEKDTTGSKYFLHPLSHELDFMNLHKAIQSNKDNIENYTSKEFSPDHLTLFLNEIKKGNLKFITVSKVKFHFTQVNNWYFELQEFNRSGYNTGWLISKLTKISNAKDKETLLQQIYNQHE
ncbi:MAG TPA: hypothetical protein VF691_02405 [Cytophagaceae bacterium]